MISRFFLPGPLSGHERVELPEAVVRHAVRVLRLSEGSAVTVFDGRGGEFAATLRCEGRQWLVQLEQFHPLERESPLACVLVQALASGDKMDWIVQKAVELGVREVVPLRAERSVVRLSPARAAKRLAHWQQIAVAACEQCGRNRVPVVRTPVSLQDYLASDGEPVVHWCLVPDADQRLGAIACPDQPVHLLVGPEAGWSEREQSLLQMHGCTTIALGPRVLRTETAGLAALAAMQSRWGDL